MKQYFICDAEEITASIASGSLLYLATGVQIEVGGSRPFKMGTDSWLDVDPSKPVYPICGSYDQYQCAIVDPKDPSGWPDRAVKNCLPYQHRNATGACDKTTFGDWKCSMEDLDAVLNCATKTGAAPPK